jgi:photosystem II stability/assembly factor-like uncharacterized protein
MHVMRNFDQIEVSHPRRRRAFAVVGAAALLFLIGALIYLRPGAPRPNPSAPARSAVVLTSPEPIAAVATAAFLDSTTGYVEFEAPGFARVFRTADAGAHWRLVYEGEPVTYLHALDDSQVLMATGLRRILASVDAGLHWRVVPPADAADSTGHVAFATHDEALALGGDGSFLVVRTDDAGAHWTSPALRGFPSGGHVLATGYRPDGSGWVLTEPLAISRAPDVYVSGDRGDDWQLRALPPVEAAQDVVVRDDGTTLYALRTFSVNRPSEGMEIYSLPGGAHDWALLDPPPLTGPPLIAAAGGTLWATSGREVWAYQDGAWQRRADLPGAGSTLYFAAFASSVLLAQSQEVGHLLLSADGGRHWSKLATPT